MNNRLPTQGSDTGDWGTMLNNLREFGHNSDGTLDLPGSVESARPSITAVTTRPVNLRSPTYGNAGLGGANDDALAFENAMKDARGSTLIIPRPPSVYQIGNSGTDAAAAISVTPSGSPASGQCPINIDSACDFGDIVYTGANGTSGALK